MVFHGISKKASLVGAFFMAVLFSLADGRSVRLIGMAWATL